MKGPIQFSQLAKPLRSMQLSHFRLAKLFVFTRHHLEKSKKFIAKVSFAMGQLCRVHVMFDSPQVSCMFALVIRSGQHAGNACDQITTHEMYHMMNYCPVKSNRSLDE